MTLRSIVVDGKEPIYVFDLDDTLYLERDFARSGFAAVGQHMRDEAGIEGFAAHCERLLSEGVRGTIFNEALRDMGLGTDPALLNRLVEIYRTHHPKISLASDAARCLARLAGRLALITDGPEETQRAKIAALRLEERIPLILATGAWPKAFCKPHPRSFEQVMAWSGQEPGAHVYIADNCAKDFVAPRGLGWRTVQIVRPGRIHQGPPPTQEHAADIAIVTLDDFPQCLEPGWQAQAVV